MATTAKVCVGGIFFLASSLTAHSDCARPPIGIVERLRIRRLYRLRILGRGHRSYEQPVSDEQTHHGSIRIQKGGQGRATRYSSRAPPCRTSTQEQRTSRQCTTPSSTHGRVRRTAARSRLPRTVPGPVRRCTSGAASTARVYTSAPARDARDGCAWWCADGNATAAPAPEHGDVSAWWVCPATTCWVCTWARDAPGWDGASTAANAVLEMFCTRVLIVFQ